MPSTVDTYSHEKHATHESATLSESAETSAAIKMPVTVIERRRSWRLIDLHELWRYRELLFFLIWRDVKVRYKQTVLGAAWAILQPFATMVVFTIFLGRLAAVSSGALPYPIFVFAGLLPWTFFANSVSSAGTSMLSNNTLVTKIFFPRLIIPASATGAALFDFLIAFGMLGLMMLYYSVYPSVGVVFVPLIILGLVLAAVGFGTLLAALTVAYRDFRYVVPFAIQLWLFATPCIYMKTDTVVGPTWQAILPLNPAFGLILNLREALLGGTIDMYSFAVSTTVACVVFAFGNFYFRRVERSFADII